MARYCSRCGRPRDATAHDRHAGRWVCGLVLVYDNTKTGKVAAAKPALAYGPRDKDVNPRWVHVDRLAGMTERDDG